MVPRVPHTPNKSLITKKAQELALLLWIHVARHLLPCP